MSDHAERRRQAVLFRLGGAPARSVAAWLSAIDRAETASEPCPTWDELEAIAPSVESPAAARFLDRAAQKEGRAL